MRYAFLLPVLLAGAAPAGADEPKRAAQPVPYRLTDTNHVLVRAKINGKGPFNLIVDTGCPVLLLAEPVGKKVGLKTEAGGLATLDKFELEGGVTLEQVPAVVKTPFQIEGMNRMNLAGVELHGLLGYTVLAKFRTEFDFTRPELRWTPLAYDPPAPAALRGKVDSGGMDMMVTLVRVLSFVAGVKSAPPQPRGFFGFELAERDDEVRVAKVLPESPAAAAGLKAGDHIEQVEGRAVRGSADVLARASKITAGRPLRLSVVRDGRPHELRLTAGDGF